MVNNQEDGPGALGSDSLQKVALVRNAQQPGDSAQHPLESVYQKPPHRSLAHEAPASPGPARRTPGTPQPRELGRARRGCRGLSGKAQCAQTPSGPPHLRKHPRPGKGHEGPARPSPVRTQPGGPTVGGSEGLGLEVGTRVLASWQTTPEAGARQASPSAALTAGRQPLGSLYAFLSCRKPRVTRPSRRRGPAQGHPSEHPEESEEGTLCPRGPPGACGGVCPQPVRAVVLSTPGNRRAGLEFRASAHHQSRGPP